MTKYCWACGASVIWPPADGADRDRCEACGQPGTLRDTPPPSPQKD